jgi:fumarate hydratase class I
VDEVVELIRACATDLPEDVEEALVKAADVEEGNARDVLDTITRNIRLARKQGKPMCQDTGTPVFYVTTPPTADRQAIRDRIVEAVGKATVEVPLRPNAVNPLNGVNTGSNQPVIHFSEWDSSLVRFEVMLKGGGSENVTRLYRLPDRSLNAGRDMTGVMKCVLDAVHRAQGRGCPPYVVGVGIGGLADTALALGKRQLLRRVDDANEDEALAGLESGLVEKINELGVGPMGLGGRTTALAVKAGWEMRHPASYFVGVSFMCWACRRRTVEVKA